MVSKINIEFDHSKISHLYVGQFGEQLLKLYFIVNGIDTFEPLVDDKGIDFIARVNANKYYDVQSKTIRLETTHYTFVHKSAWQNELRDNQLIAVTLLKLNETPKILLIPATAWLLHTTEKIFVDRATYEKPEWGINISERNIPFLLEHYEIGKTLKKILELNASR